jgi:hypothetical protein
MNVCKLGLSIAMLLSGGMAFAQGTVDDYNRAYALREKFSANKVFYSNVTPQWIEGTHQFWKSPCQTNMQQVFMNGKYNKG